MDANETFNNVSQHTAGGTANTGRGDLILQWMLQQNLTLPPQQNHLPTYCPYNHQMQPRRLDYIMVRGTTAGAGRVCQCKDRASSSYKCQLRAETTHAKQSRLFPKPPQSESRGGGVTGFQKVPSSSDYATKRSTRSQGGESRQAWKEVAKTRKREKRAWEQQQATLAASLDWKAMRSLHHAKTHRGLAPTIAGRCTGNKSWKKKHEGIFAKPRPINSTARILELQRQLRWKCKHTPWVPFQHQELAHTSSTWAKNKSTGPDGSSHEAAKALLAEPVGG